MAAWFEGTDLYDLGPLDLGIVSFRGELIPSEHDLWQTLNSVWNGWDKIVKELEVEDPEVVQRLFYERHALASYRRHISPPRAHTAETRNGSQLSGNPRAQGVSDQ